MLSCAKRHVHAATKGRLSPEILLGSQKSADTQLCPIPKPVYLSGASKDRGLRWWLRHPEGPDAIFRPNDESVLKSRMEVLFRVRKAVEKRFGSAYKVSTFGSVRYGATSTNSDMDLIIIDLARPKGFPPYYKEELPMIYRLNALAQVLRASGFFGVRGIRASVPIVKCTDRRTGIDCDININDQPGYWNSLMLQRYSQLSPHLPRMLLAIKRWSRPLGLNTPSPKAKGEILSFSSYMFALMTVGFLQSRGLLPNLQKTISPDVREHFFWNRKPPFLCDLRFNRIAPPRPVNEKVSTTALLHDWFRFWADFDPARDMVDIRQGGIVPRANVASMPRYPNKWSTKLVHKRTPVFDVETVGRWELDPICVIDPFVRVKNVGKNISEKVLKSFQAECGRAAEDMRRVDSPIREEVAM